MAKIRFSKTTTILLVILLLLLVGSGVGYLVLRVNQDEQISSEDSEAASEEVTDADKLDSSILRQEFAQGWENFSKEDHTSIEYVERAITPEGSRYKCDQEIMQVGSETLYGCDLNALFVIHEYKTYTQTDEITPQNTQLNSVLDELITQSGLLQKGEELGLVELTSEIYNSPDKDILKRYEELRSLRDQIGEKMVKRIDFEAVGIYFFNEHEIERDITLEEAKQAAKIKMDFIYDLLKEDKITMKEAGEMIKNDNICYEDSGIKTCEQSGVSNSQLDVLYKENAYYAVVGHEFDVQAFRDPTYEEELRSLGEGQISTVRIFKDYKFTSDEYDKLLEGEKLDLEMVESAYFIFKNNKIRYGINEDLESGSATGVEENIKKEFDDKVTIK